MVGHTFSLLSRYVGPHGMIAYLCNHHLWSREFKLTFIMVVHLVLLSTCRPRNHAHLRSRDFKLTIIMIEHLLLLSRYVGNRGPNLRSRDFKLTNKCVYPSFSFLPTTARKSKGSHFNYFFIHTLKPRYSNISKTVKIKGCEHPAAKFLARASVPKETQAFTQITLHQLCKKQRVIQLMD